MNTVKVEKDEWPLWVKELNRVTDYRIGSEKTQDGVRFEVQLTFPLNKAKTSRQKP